MDDTLMMPLTKAVYLNHFDMSGWSDSLTITIIHVFLHNLQHLFHSWFHVIYVTCTFGLRAGRECEGRHIPRIHHAAAPDEANRVSDRPRLHGSGGRVGYIAYWFCDDSGNMFNVPSVQILYRRFKFFKIFLLFIRLHSITCNISKMQLSFTKRLIKKLIMNQ